jgi:ubiquitin-conjugating enzyme E2 Z
MSNNPYENEPGFDKANSEDDKKKQAAYVAKIRHETIRIAVIQKLEDIMGVCPNGEYFSTSHLPYMRSFDLHVHAQACDT